MQLAPYAQKFSVGPQAAPSDRGLHPASLNCPDSSKIIHASYGKPQAGDLTASKSPYHGAVMSQDPLCNSPGPPPDQPSSQNQQTIMQSFLMPLVSPGFVHWAGLQRGLVGAVAWGQLDGNWSQQN